MLPQLQLINDYFGSVLYFALIDHGQGFCSTLKYWNWRKSMCHSAFKISKTHRWAIYGLFLIFQTTDIIDMGKIKFIIGSEFQFVLIFN